MYEIVLITKQTNKGRRQKSIQTKRGDKNSKMLGKEYIQFYSTHNQASNGQNTERRKMETECNNISSLPSLLLMMVSSVCLYMNECSGGKIPQPLANFPETFISR